MWVGGLIFANSGNKLVIIAALIQRIHCVIEISAAQTHDIAALVALEQTYLNDELSSGSEMLEGAALSRQDFEQLIRQGLIAVARDTGCTTPLAIIGYAVTGPWQFFQQWPLYRRALQHSHQAGIRSDNTCQYGPVWVSEQYRRQGICRALQQWLASHLRGRYQSMLTLIAEANEGSFIAHTRRGDMQVIDFMDYEDRGYYLLQYRM